MDSTVNGRLHALHTNIRLGCNFDKRTSLPNFSIIYQRKGFMVEVNGISSIEVLLRATTCGQFGQGLLTEGEGSVQLTSSLR